MMVLKSLDRYICKWDRAFASNKASSLCRVIGIGHELVRSLYEEYSVTG